MQRYGIFIWLTTLGVIAAFLIVPQTREIFTNATTTSPYLMGFVKFAILSTMGEFLALRVVSKKWSMVKGVVQKMLIWGLLGAMIVFMFSLYTNGVDGTIETNSKLVRALYISAVMNLTFAPVFMAAHRITDTVIESRYSKKELTAGEAVSSIDWVGFLKFVVFKTIPLFWIPAHTITFLLPNSYRVIFAASLSIVLGLILSIAKSRK